MSSSFPYDQPALSQLLVLTSFLYLLNGVRVLADFVLHAGIVAELFLGVVYGSPLAGILTQDWETTFSILGYIGLICIVFEGGLSTNLPVLLANLPLSCLCALTGIAVPIALSFALLMGGFGYEPLEAFAAGAALSSTSLGTTLAALNSASKTISGDRQNASNKRRSSPKNTANGADMDVDVTANTIQEDVELVHRTTQDNRLSEDVNTHGSPSSFLSCVTLSCQIPLQQTRIGTVLISAAVIDDVVGLVIAALIPSLAALNNSDLFSYPAHQTSNLAWTIIRPLLSSVLIAIITPLVAKCILRPGFWFRGIGEQWCAPRRPGKGWGWSRTISADEVGITAGGSSEWGKPEHADAIKLGLIICVVSAFVAIAYYTSSSALFGAYVAGLSLSYISRPPEDETIGEEWNVTSQEERMEAISLEGAYSRTIGPLQQYILAPLFFASIGYAIPFLSLWDGAILWRGLVYASLMCVGKLAVGLPIMLWTFMPQIYHARSLPTTIRRSPDPGIGRQPPSLLSSFRTAIMPSLYPATFIGVAMVSRGEIGLLIAQIARQGSTANIYSNSESEGGLLSSDAFLVCTWAILVCTLMGPIGVGYVVRRWRAEVTHGIWS